MRWLAILAASMLLAAPALADVDVEIEYDKLVNIDVDETVDIDKVIDLIAVVDLTPERAAEADALINQANHGNEACENCAEKRDRIIDSLSDNDGVLDVNQAAGNMNNQGNAVSIAVDDRTITPDNPETSFKEGQTFAHAQAAVDQLNGGFREDPGSTDSPVIVDGNLVDATNLLEKSAAIESSVNNNTGVVHVNQSTGNMYNQANSLAMAVGFGEGGVAIASSDLGQSNTDNSVFEAGQAGSGESAIINKFVDISDSVNANSGVVGVNQGAGNMGNQANVVSLAVIVAGNGGEMNGTAAAPAGL